MEDLVGRRKTLERERLRLEKLLDRHPQWRMMRAADELPRRMDGVWQFPGLNRVQASALRESLVFRAYDDVVDQLAKLDERREAVRGLGGKSDGEVSSDSESKDPLPLAVQAAACETTPSGPARRDLEKREDQRPVSPQDKGVVAGQAPAFRTRVKIKPIARPATLGQAEMEDRGRPPDDFTRIRSINRALARALSKADVSSFAQIAAWNGEEVRRIASELDLGTRIWQEGWIEQAAALVLKGGGALPAILGRTPSRQADASRGSDAAVSRPVDGCGDGDGAGEADKQRDALPGPAVESDGEAAETAPRATAMPATEALPIVRLTERSELEPAGEDGQGGEVSGDHEAAAPAAEVGVPEIETPVDDVAEAPAEPEEARLPIAATAPVPMIRPAGWGESHKVGRRPPRLPPPAVRRLTYVRGLSDDMANRLRANGVRSLEEIAEWRAPEVEWFQVILGDEARISADQWIEQAALIAQGRWTTYALELVQRKVPEVVAWPEPAGVRRVSKAGDGACAASAVRALDAAAPMRETAPQADEAATGAVLEVGERVASGTAVAAVAPADRVELGNGIAAGEKSAAETVSDVAGRDVVLPTVSRTPTRQEPASDASDETPPTDTVQLPAQAVPEKAALSNAAVVVAPIVAPLVPVNRSAPAVAPEAGAPTDEAGQPVPETLRDAPPASAADEPEHEAPAADAAGDRPPADTVTPAEVRDRSQAARPAASLFADTLVEQLTLKPASASERRPVTDPFDQRRDPADTLPEAAATDRPSTVQRWYKIGVARNECQSTVGRAAQTAKDGDTAHPSTQVSVDAADANDSAVWGDTSETGRLGSDSEVFTVRAQEDSADAEAVVNRRVPAHDPQSAPGAMTSAADRSAATASWAEGREQRDRSQRAGVTGDLSDGTLDDPARGDDDADGFTPFGEEASVRIVSRRADRPRDGGGAAERDAAGGDGEAIAAEREAGVQSGARQRLGFSPGFLVRRMEHGEDEAEGAYAGYRDVVDEAMVTIVRAEGQMALGSSIVPEQIANDQLDGESDASRKDSPEADEGSFKERVLGSRFLKALTGE